MTPQPLVSIVMPVRNPDPRHFSAAIDSLLAQTLRDFEIVIVEDAGGRPTANSPFRSIRDYLARFDDERIRHVENREPGLANALNCGLTEARGLLRGFRS